MSLVRLATAAIAALALAPVAALAQSEIRCASRNFQHQFCPAVEDVVSARLIVQDSRSACIQGRTWGWSRQGVWVTSGCSARFAVDGPRPPPWGGGTRVSCDSDGFRYQFCGVGGGVSSAQIVNHRSRSPCILGRSWGWRGDGIWVNDGCQADFIVQSSWRPVPPPASGVTVCESLGYRYNFCNTGRIRDARLVSQRSSASCVRGRSWGVEGNGIWVDNGCQATFRLIR